MDRYAPLFAPLKIGPKTAPNRFFAVPHATGHGWAQPNGEIALRAMKAEGGWGTVAVQMTEIAPDSDMANHPMQRLWDDTDIPRHVAQVEAIQSHGSLAAIELAHGGMRARNFVTGHAVLGPSNLPILRPEIPLQARAMTLDDIKAFRSTHRDAVKRAIKAGYDIIYVYAAHDLSILSHFFSERTNRREDAYGGSFDNRLRLLKEVLTDTLEICEGTAAVALRFSVAEPDHGDGIRHDGEGRDVVEALADLPDLWDVNVAGWPADSRSARFSGEGFQLPFTRFVKDVTSKPVVGVGRFTSPDTMLSLVTSGQLDLIGAARPSIADPFLPSKLREGRQDDIRECIGCNICVSMDGYGVPVRCTQNATISEEWVRGWHPEKITSAKSIPSCLIVGSGPAGLEAARILANAGAHVTLAEKRPEFGGRVLLESALPGLQTWRRVIDYRLGQLQGRANVEMFTESEATPELVAEIDPDHTVLATGSHWRSDGVGSTNFNPIGFERLITLTPDDLFRGQRPSGSQVTVYDDDHFYMGSVLAELLAQEGYQVTYATPLPLVSSWTDMTLDQNSIISRMVDLGTRISVNTKLNQHERFASTLDGTEIDLPGDDLIFIGARQPDVALRDALEETGSENMLHLAGDCDVPGIIQAAVHSGHRIARRIIDPAGEVRRDGAPPFVQLRP